MSVTTLDGKHVGYLALSHPIAQQRRLDLIFTTVLLAVGSAENGSIRGRNLRVRHRQHAASSRCAEIGVGKLGSPRKAWSPSW